MAVVSNGTTLIDNGALDAGVPTGSLILLSTQTASASASISFTTGIDSTYKAYKFVFVNIHPSTANAAFQFNLSTDSGSNYNVTKTTTFFKARHYEDDTNTEFTYEPAFDLAQSTSYQTFTESGVRNGDDDSLSGYFHIFNPSSTVYVKHFMANCDYAGSGAVVQFNSYMAGYGNTTSAVDAVRFQMASGNIDDGIIKLYGVK
jgi:hypothetical protein